MAARDRTGGDGAADGVTWRPTDWTPYEAWARGYVKRNYWRVDRILKRDDALQECMMIYVHCCRLYEGKVDNPAWFMSLFKTAVANGFNSHAEHNQRTKLNQLAAETLAARAPTFDFNNGPLYAALSQASIELKVVLRCLASAPAELRLLMLDRVNHHHSQAYDEGLSRALCRLARVRNVRSDLLTELREILSHDNI